ncbi:MAG: hypothetical protein CL928_18925 [Deltaproteobacteria bacterium]|nr:hypothetical protein [Deltaproteobacteria bacterium]
MSSEFRSLVRLFALVPVLAAGLLVLLVPPAQANPADLFGMGAPSMGRGRAGIVLDADPFAVWRNPAAMGFAPRDAASVVGFFGWMDFDCLGEETDTDPVTCERNVLYDGNQDGVVDHSEPSDYWLEEDYEGPTGLQLGYLRALGKWLRLGFTIALPPKRIVLFEQHDPYLPYYPRWRSWPHRVGVHLGASGRITEGLHIGLGVTVLAQARIDLSFEVDALVTDDQIADQGTAGDLDVDLLINTEAIRADVRPALGPVAAVSWDLGNIVPKLKGLRLGVVYRHPIQIQVDPAVLQLDFNALVQEIGSLGEVLIPIQTQIVYAATDFATPRQVALGLGYTHPRFQLAVDLTWNQWSAIVPNAAQINEELTDIEIGLIDLNAQVLNARVLEPLNFRDTITVRVGGELRPPALPLSGKLGSRLKEVGFVVRAGYGYDPAFIPEQTGLTNFLDNGTHTATLGLGVWTHDALQLMGGPIALDLFGQLHILEPRTHTKDPEVAAAGYPEGWPTLGEVRSGGLVGVVGLGLSLSI